MVRWCSGLTSMKFLVHWSHWTDLSQLPNTNHNHELTAQRNEWWYCYIVLFNTQGMQWQNTQSVVISVLLIPREMLLVWNKLAQIFCKCRVMLSLPRLADSVSGSAALLWPSWCKPCFRKIQRKNIRKDKSDNFFVLSSVFCTAESLILDAWSPSLSADERAERS